MKNYVTPATVFPLCKLHVTLNTETIMDGMADIGTSFLCNKAAILRDMTRFTIQQVLKEYETQHTLIHGNKTVKFMYKGL
jgi:hypothetical protein